MEVRLVGSVAHKAGRRKTCEPNLLTMREVGTSRVEFTRPRAAQLLQRPISSRKNLKSPFLSRGQRRLMEMARGLQIAERTSGNRTMPRLFSNQEI